MYKITSVLGRNLNCALPSCRPYTYCVVRQYNNLNLRRPCPSDFLSSKFMAHDGCALGSVRNYAKGKDKKKDKGQKKISIDENLLSQYLKFNNMKSEMEKAVVNLKNSYIKNLSLRSSTGALESLPVTFEGDEYVIQDLAQIVRKNPKTIILNMSSFPLAIPSVLESLKNSGMNLNPQQEKTSIFIPIPKVTKEHRENLIKGAKGLFVKCKDSIKEVQNKNIKLLKDNDSLSEDLVHNLKDQITMLADKYVMESQRIMEEKQNELKGD